jgi:triacylglycerol lipase
VTVPPSRDPVEAEGVMPIRVLLLPMLLAFTVAGGFAFGWRSTVRPPASAAATRPAPPTVMDSPRCRPPARHPDPVVLVHGTFATTDWQLIGPALARRGYCVFTFDYGNLGTGEIAHSAHELDRFVDAVLARTHARRVSIVGHSEGGMMPRYYIRFLGGASKVDDLIALAPSNYGTQNPLVLEGAAWGCRACAQQQAIGSRFLRRLNAGNGTPGPVDYTVIQTAFDGIVVPYQSAFLRGPARRVTNVTLQRHCAGDLSGHLAITTDPVALRWVENALARPGPASRAFHPRCD